MWFRRRFDFFKLLADQSRLSEDGLRLLCEFMRRPSEELGVAIDQAEKKADGLRRELIEAINRTLITPIDREDIFALSGALDDMIDYAASTVEEMLLFEASTNGFMTDLADGLYEEARHVTRAVEALATMDKRLQEHIIAAKKSENRVEHIYREALAELFRGRDTITILKLREIYRHLSNAADRGDEAADILSDILVKNT